MGDKDKLTIAEIEAMHEKVQTGEIEPYEPDTPEWANLLYELAVQDLIRDDGVKAALTFLKDSVTSDTEISSGTFKTFMSDAYKGRWGTKGEYGRYRAYDFLDEETLDRMRDYIDWESFGEDLSPDGVEYVQPEGPFGPVWAFDANFEF